MLKAWPLAEHLEGFLKAKSAFALKDVHAGYSDEPFTVDETIEITWDEEIKDGPHMNGGTVTLWVDCWLTNADRTAGAAAGALATLLNTTLGAIFPKDKSAGWPLTAQNELNLGLRVTIERVVSDAGTRLPQTGARIVLQIQYNN